MSGRLIILPKKSYCPWNPKNVERVLRDERIHRENQQREQDDSTILSQEARMAALKAARQSSSVSDQNQSTSTTSQTQQHQHVNLFAAEEMQAAQDLVGGLGKKQKNISNNNTSHNGGLQPLYLGQSAKVPAFYLQQNTTTKKNQKDDEQQPQPQPRRNHGDDPMARFLTTESSQSCRKQVTSDTQTTRVSMTTKNQEDPSRSEASVGKHRGVNPHPHVDKKRNENRRKKSDLSKRSKRKTLHHDYHDAHGESQSSTKPSSSSSSSSSDESSHDERRRRKHKRHRRGRGEIYKTARRDKSKALSCLATEDANAASTDDDSSWENSRRKRRYKRKRAKDHPSDHHSGSTSRPQSVRDNSSRTTYSEGVSLNKSDTNAEDPSVDSVEDLRQRRAAREEREQQRQRALLQENSSRGSYNHTRTGGYLNQYNPTLSRR
jgi:hypothetical protein